MNRVRLVWSGIKARVSASAAWLWREAVQILDRDAFLSAADWRGRLQAVSWRRAAVAGGSLASLVLVAALAVWLMQPDFRGRPPRLPTEQEWRVTQEATQAMDAELSPALAAANRSVTP